MNCMRLGTLALLMAVNIAPLSAQTAPETSVDVAYTSPSDSRMLWNMRLLLAGDPALQEDGTIIDTTLADGIVTLTGTVNSNATRSYASEDVAMVPGVSAVLNHLDIHN